MSSFLRFYARTWWLWLIYAALLAVLGATITWMFYIGIVLLVPFSVYFALVRGTED